MMNHVDLDVLVPEDGVGLRSFCLFLMKNIVSFWVAVRSGRGDMEI